MDPKLKVEVFKNFLNTKEFIWRKIIRSYAFVGGILQERFTFFISQISVMDTLRQFVGKGVETDGLLL